MRWKGYDHEDDEWLPEWNMKMQKRYQKDTKKLRDWAYKWGRYPYVQKKTEMSFTNVAATFNSNFTVLNNVAHSLLAIELRQIAWNHDAIYNTAQRNRLWKDWPAKLYKVIKSPNMGHVSLYSPYEQLVTL